MIQKIYKFSATWCQPCKQLSTTLMKLAPEFPSVVIEHVDIDQDPAVAKMFNVKSVPTLVFGDRRLQGNLPIGQVRAFLKGGTCG